MIKRSISKISVRIKLVRNSSRCSFSHLSMFSISDVIRLHPQMKLFLFILYVFVLEINRVPYINAHTIRNSNKQKKIYNVINNFVFFNQILTTNIYSNYFTISTMPSDKLIFTYNSICNNNNKNNILRVLPGW